MIAYAMNLSTKKEYPMKQPARVWTDKGNDEPYYYTNALCKTVDPELFFPDERRFKHHTENAQVRAAKKICGNCEHQVECAAYAIIRPYVQGIWGGTTTTERQTIRRKHGIVGLTDTSLANNVIDGY